MIDALHTLIGQTARFATPREAEELLRIAADNDARFIAIKKDKYRFNVLLEKVKWREERKEREREKTPAKKEG